MILLRILAWLVVMGFFAGVFLAIVVINLLLTLLAQAITWIV